MRLHHLKITGIGPYAGSEEIDFDRLSEAGVHLLTGSTGSGKTTVLDAIAFALFGEVPRTSKGTELVSDHRDPETTPEVVLEVTIGGTRVRVTRSPVYLREKMTGEGTTGAKQLLRVERRQGSEWHLLTDTWKEGNRDLEERLGMNADQFSQVVMLPQGEFARFLRADVNARQQLLERLFPGNDLAYVERWLKDRARDDGILRTEKQNEIERCFHRIETVLSRLEPDENGERPRLPELAEPGPVTEWMAGIGERLGLEEIAAETARANALTESEGADRKLNQLEKKADLIRQRKVADSEYEKLNGRSAWRRRLGEEVAAAERAAKVVAIIRKAESDERVAKAATATLDEVRAELAADPGIGTVAPTGLEELLPTIRAEATTLRNFEQDELPRRRSRGKRVTALETDQEALTDESPGSEVAKAVAAHEAAVKARNDAQVEHLRIRESRTRSMAAELATVLVAGEPCAVCGSTEHPAPADPRTVEFSREDEERAERAIGTISVREEAARESLEAARTEAARRRTELESELKQARRELEDLTKRETALAGSASTVPARREELEHQVALIEKLLDAGKRADDRHQAAASAREDADRTATENGFESLNQVRSAALQDDLLADRKKQLSGHDESVARVRGRLEGELARVDPTERVDLVPAKARAESARRVRDEKTGSAKSAAERARDFREPTAPVPALYAELAPLREAAARSEEMNQLAKGDNSRRMKLSIYVLAARLKQVIQAANHHLVRMSNQRYELAYSGDLERHGATSGLGIEVIDAYTSKSRPTSSLSGGESFYASLSLALGLAEVVQQESGGRRLETLFIDEGFGTLDGKTLDQVMDVIDSLREGGRSVGLVSHVEELRNRIPAQIQVTANRDGSTITVVA